MPRQKIDDEFPLPTCLTCGAEVQEYKRNHSIDTTGFRLLRFQCGSTWLRPEHRPGGYEQSTACGKAESMLWDERDRAQRKE